MARPELTETIVGPDRGWAWPVAICLGALGAIALVVTIGTFRIVGISEPVLPLVPGIVTLGFFALTAWCWRVKPAGRGEILGRPGGVRVWWKPAFGRKRGPFDIDWPEIAALRHWQFRASNSAFGIELTHDGAVRLGMVQPTARPDAARMLVRQTLWIPKYCLDRDEDGIVAALTPHLAAAGFDVVYEGGEYGVASVRRWRVTPAGA